MTNVSDLRAASLESQAAQELANSDGWAWTERLRLRSQLAAKSVLSFSVGPPRKHVQVLFGGVPRRSHVARGKQVERDVWQLCRWALLDSDLSNFALKWAMLAAQTAGGTQRTTGPVLILAALVTEVLPLLPNKHDLLLHRRLVSTNGHWTIGLRDWAVTPNPSLEPDLHRHGTARRRSLSSSASRAKRHAGVALSSNVRRRPARCRGVAFSTVEERLHQFRSSAVRPQPLILRSSRSRAGLANPNVSGIGLPERFRDFASPARSLELLQFMVPPATAALEIDLRRLEAQAVVFASLMDDSCSPIEADRAVGQPAPAWSKADRRDCQVWTSSPLPQIHLLRPVHPSQAKSSARGYPLVDGSASVIPCHRIAT